MAKRKAKRKSARRAKPSKVQRTLVRLEKAIVAQELRIDRIIEGLTERAFHEKQPAAPLTNGPQTGPLTDPE
jgi:hypothetical protein